MSDLRSQLPPDIQQAADQEFTSQVKQAFDSIVTIDGRLTQHNFLVNAGGAVAVLAFIGARPYAGFSFWPLGLFLLGVVASGVELRALLIWSSHLHNDAMERRRKFAADTLPLSQAVPAADLAKWWRRLNHWSGICSQVCFIFGTVAGLLFAACGGLTRQ